MTNSSSTTLQEKLYENRVIIGNVIAFLGFVLVWVDPYARVTMPRLLAGAFIGGTGFGLRVWASSYQWPNIATAQPDSRTGLLTAGPYAYLRHPIYLSMFLLTAGAFLAFGSWLAALVTVIPTYLVNWWQARYEEGFLVEKYGREATEYQQHLPMFIPNPFKPYPVRNGQFALSQGIKHDIGPLSAFACFIVLMLVVTLVQPPTLPMILGILVGSILLSFVLVWLVRRVFKEQLSL